MAAEVVALTAEQLLEQILNAIIDGALTDDHELSDEFITSLTDDDFGNNSIEQIFLYKPELDKDIVTGEYKNVTVFQEMSARLSLIDTRLQMTNDILSGGFSFIATGLVVAASFKVFTWFYNVLGV